MENEVQPIQQPTPPPVSLSDKLKNFATRRNLIVAGVIAVVILISAFLLLRLPGKNPTKTGGSSSTPTSYGKVYFEPFSLKATINTPQSADIIINTDGMPITGVIIAVQYNPLLMTNVTLTQKKDPQSAFSSGLVQTGQVWYDTANGTATMTLQLPPKVPDFPLNGKVATLTFTPKPLTVAIRQAVITLMNNTSFFVKNQGTHNQITRMPLTVIYK